jgi:hypothetical protein
MRKLFAAGCSISTRCSGKTSYPEELSKLLNYELVNCTAGCGSNYRIWRTITKHIMDGNLTSDDLLVIQYTEPTRREFWSKFPKNNDSFKDLYDDGTIVRFKFDSYIWQKTKEEIEFLRLYEFNHVNDTFETENFNINNFNFQHMLKNHNIKVIFIKTTRISVPDFFTFDEYKKYFYYDVSNKDVTNNQNSKDIGHFNDKGHKLIAENLYQHILNLKLNE